MVYSRLPILISLNEAETLAGYMSLLHSSKSATSVDISGRGLRVDATYEWMRQQQ